MQSFLKGLSITLAILFGVGGFIGSCVLWSNDATVGLGFVCLASSMFTVMICFMGAVIAEISEATTLNGYTQREILQQQININNYLLTQVNKNQSQSPTVTNVENLPQI